MANTAINATGILNKCYLNTTELTDAGFTALKSLIDTNGIQYPWGFFTGEEAFTIMFYCEESGTSGSDMFVSVSAGKPAAATVIEFNISDIDGTSENIKMIIVCDTDDWGAEFGVAGTKKNRFYRFEMSGTVEEPVFTITDLTALGNEYEIAIGATKAGGSSYEPAEGVTLPVTQAVNDVFINTIYEKGTGPTTYNFTASGTHCTVNPTSGSITPGETAAAIQVTADSGYVYDQNAVVTVTPAGAAEYQKKSIGIIITDATSDFSINVECQPGTPEPEEDEKFKSYMNRLKKFIINMMGKKISE